MSYQPLARKYRPHRFSDLIGQEAVALALSNAIKLGRAPAGVLFAGVRGIGKTTTARLYAKALNCEAGPSPEPCDTCASCLAINGGYHEDVLEIDGASNNGVDEIRALKETLGYVPQRSLYKVYLIDEVHMLSLSAFNALLKTLEEPPKHVVFIFATTEIQKVPQTIIGRCQTFHLQKLSLAATQARLADILDREGLSYEADALLQIAREGRGSMRDALTCLDQAIALGEGLVTKAAVAKIFAGQSWELNLGLLAALLSRDPSQCLSLIAQMDQAGCDFSESVEALARTARHGFVLQSLAGKEAWDTSLLDLSDAERRALQELVAQAEPLGLNRLFRSMIKCRRDLDGSELDRFVFENYCLEWCLDPGLPALPELMQAFSKAPAPAPGPVLAPVTVSAPVSALVSAPIQQPPAAPRFVADLQALRAQEEKKSLNSTIKELGLQKGSDLHAKRQVLDFPASWDALVRAWKGLRPLEARQWEEVYVRTYSAERIELAVKKDGLLAARCLDPEQQRLVKKSLQNMFAFKGDIQVSLLDPEEKLAAGSLSILEQRQEQQKTQTETTLREAEEHPLTQALLSELGGRLEKVSLRWP